MSFAHLTIATRDVPRTAAFYENAMGWPRVKAPANAPEELNVAWVELGPGNQQIHILHVPDYSPSSFEAEFGRHFAVFHPAADFPDLKRRLVEHGASLMDPIRETPFERFFFRDFNGYVFEVIAREQCVRE